MLARRSKQFISDDDRTIWDIIKEKSTPYVMLLPAMAFIALFTIYPIIRTVRLSFHEYNFIRAEQYVGINNYKTLLVVREDFTRALGNTAFYTAGILAFTIILSVVFAVWLQKDTKLNRFSQTAIFTPHLIATFSCGMIWAWIMSDAGILNTALSALGLPTSKWLNSSETAMPSLIMVSVWKSLGYYTLVVMSALKAIPTEIYEAVDLDDTGVFKKFFRITIPMLSPQLFFLLITITIASFKVFDTVKVMTAGGPGDATMVLTYFIYYNSFHLFKIGYGASAACVFLVILSILTVIYFKGLERKVHYQ